MKSILLTTTALVAFAGAAAADGHISMSWSGTATAGIAREGGSDGAPEAVEATVEALVEAYEGANVLVDEANVTLFTVGVVTDLALLDGGAAPADTAEAVARARANVATLVEYYTAADAAGVLTSGSLAAAAAQAGAHLATADQLFGTADVATGDFEEYAEINATVTGTVALDSGVTVSASMSVDAGRGYDFADDDGFDSSGAQSGSVGFDNVTVDAGAYGTLVLNPNDIAHLVDDDDDASADFSYTNDFGVASVSFVMDIDTDSDTAARNASWALVDDADLADIPSGSVVLSAPGFTSTGGLTPLVEYTESNYGPGTQLIYTPAIAADVQWSAKVSAPVADIATVYAAFDEEGGYDVGASATVAGVAVTAKVKSEALAVELGDDPEFDIDAAYTISGLTIGGGWNSVEDGDQWDIRASYTMSGLTVSASTDEGEDWEVTGSYALSDNASLEAGVNYTEDAYVGVSFSF